MKMLWALLFVWVVGSASHFFYGWSGENPLVGLLFASSESVWEHSKLGFWPLCLAILWLGKGAGANWATLAWAMACGTLFYLVHQIGAFYAYTSALGITSCLPVDILIYLLASAGGLWMGYRLLGQPRPLWQGALGVGILCFLALSLVVFTRESPSLPLFWDPAKK